MTDLSLRPRDADDLYDAALADRRSVRVGLVLSASLAVFALWVAPGLGDLKSSGSLFPSSVHVIAETFSVVVSAMVFAVAWNAPRPEATSNLTLLACGFLAVALLDLAHMLSYSEMPAFVTVSSPQKAIAFWLGARLVAATSILVYAVRPWPPFEGSTARYAFLGGTIAAVAAIVALQLSVPEAWPTFFLDGRGPTTVKIGLEWLAVAITVGAMMLLWLRPLPGARVDAGAALTASFFIILTSLCLSVYTNVHDVFSLLGHVCKVVAYYFIYRLSFVASVRRPYARLRAETTEKLAAERAAAEARERLAAIVESSHDAILGTDLSGVVTSWNAGAARMFGYASDEIVGRPVALLTPPGRQAGSDAALADAVERVHAAQYECVGITRDGRAVDVAVVVSPVFDASGKLSGTSRVARDITERKRAEAALQAYAQRLQSLSRRLMEVEEHERRRLGRELHDRTGSNLTAMLLGTAVMRSRLSPEQVAEVGPQLDECERLIRETMQHVRDVLADLRPAGLDDLGLVAAITHHVRAIARHGGIDCEVRGTEIAPRLPPDVEISLFRIVQEALNNALKHASAAHVRVVFAHDADRVRLTVEDDGRGFASTPGDADSTGLGMVTMRERAEAVGAAFSVDSAPGRGTRVVVTLPRPGAGHP